MKRLSHCVWFWAQICWDLVSLLWERESEDDEDERLQRLRLDLMAKERD